MWVIIIIIVTRSVQPEPPAVAIVRQNGRFSASCRASVAVTPVSRQIWWVQVVDGGPQARLQVNRSAVTGDFFASKSYILGRPNWLVTML